MLADALIDAIEIEAAPPGGRLVRLAGPEVPRELGHLLDYLRWSWAPAFVQALAAGESFGREEEGFRLPPERSPDAPVQVYDLNGSVTLGYGAFLRLADRVCAALLAQADSSVRAQDWWADFEAAVAAVAERARRTG